jgi:hypothetical protein
MASAARISVTVDLKTRNTPVSLTAQDADVTAVLSALFNAIDNKYQLQTGIGISGKIDELQLTQVPFDDALTAILAKANPNFTFIKEDGGIYRISNSSAIDAVTPVLSLYMPAITDHSMVTMKATLPYIDPSKYITATDATGKSATADNKAKNNKPVSTAADAGNADSLLGGDTVASTGDATGKDDKPTTEECFVAMIQIHFQPVHVFSVGFGAQELPDFSTLANPSGSTGGSGSGGFGYGGMNGTNSSYGNQNSLYGNQYGSSAYGNQYGSSLYGSAYGNTYGSSYPYGSSAYGNTSAYGLSSYPYSTGTTGVTTTSSTSGAR